MKPSIMDVLAGPKAAPAPAAGRVVRNLGIDDPRGNRGERWEKTPARLANAARARQVLAVVRKTRDEALWAGRRAAIVAVLAGRRAISSEIAVEIDLDARVVRDLVNEMYAAQTLDFVLVPTLHGGPAAKLWFLKETGDDRREG